MTCLCTHASPFRVDVSVGPFNEVKCILYPLVHLRHGNNVLSLLLHAPTAIGSLARNTAGQDRQRLHAQVFAELEILVVTQSH